jgi:hypothetical protein
VSDLDPSEVAAVERSERDAARADAARLRSLTADLTAAAFAAPATEWLTEDLWTRLVAECPKPERYQRAGGAAADVPLWEA